MKHSKATDEALMLALACGATVEVAAQKTGVSQRTVYRRLEDPDFRHALSRYRSDMVHRSSGMLTAAAMEAVKTLLGLMERTTPPGVRLGAARSVLEMGMQLRAAHDVEERLRTVEQRLLADDPGRLPK